MDNLATSVPTDSALVLRSNGSPLAYNIATIFPRILERLATGESLRQICRDDGMPAWNTVAEWGTLPEWSDRYARARELGWSAVGEDLLDISDDSRNDWMDRETEKGRVERVLDREHIERTRIRLDTRKWLLAKMLPKVYGDRLAIDASVAVLTAFVDLAPRSPVVDAEADALPHVEPPDRR